MGCCVDVLDRREGEFAAIRNLFEQVLSLPQRHVRPTFRSGKSAFVGLGPEAAANHLAFSVDFDIQGRYCIS